MGVRKSAVSVAKVRIERGYCEGGCQVPVTGVVDPFIEFTSAGFRGDGEYTCNRACSNYLSIPSDKLTDAEKAEFVTLCAIDRQPVGLCRPWFRG